MRAQVVAQRAGERLFQQPKVVDREVNDDGSVTECVEIVAADASEYAFRVTMYDLFSDGERIDEWLQDNDYQARSYDSLDFPLHIESDTEFMCYDVSKKQFERFPWQRDVDTVNGCQPTTVREDACQTNKNGSCKTTPVWRVSERR